MSVRGIFERFVLYIYFFLIITYGSSVYFKNSVALVIGALILGVLMYVILLYALLQDKHSKKLIKVIPFLLLYYMYIFIYIIFGENIKLFIFDFIFVVSSMIVVNQSIKYFRTKFDYFIILNNLILILVVISLFFYFFGSLLGIISPTHYTDITWGHLYSRPTYYFFHYDYQYVFFNGNVIPRNSGIYLEAGIFSFFINLALLIEVFGNVKNKRKVLRIVTLIIGVLTTISTTGYIVMGLMLFFALVKYKVKNRALKVLKMLMILISLIVVFFISVKVLEAKVNNESGNRSYSIRVDDIVLGYKAFQINKDFGLGYKDSTEYMQLQSKDIRGENISGGSNGWMILLYQGGIYLLLGYITMGIFSYRYLREKYTKTFANFLCVFLIIQLASIPLQYFWFMLWFCTIGFLNVWKKEIINRNV